MALISAMPSVLVKHLCWGLYFTVFIPPSWARTHSQRMMVVICLLCARTNNYWTELAGGLWEALRWGGASLWLVSLWICARTFTMGSLMEILIADKCNTSNRGKAGWKCLPKLCTAPSRFDLLMLQWPASHHGLLSSRHDHVISTDVPFLLFICGEYSVFWEWNDYTSHVHLSITLTKEGKNTFIQLRWWEEVYRRWALMLPFFREVTVFK